MEWTVSLEHKPAHEADLNSTQKLQLASLTHGLRFP